MIQVRGRGQNGLNRINSQAKQLKGSNGKLYRNGISTVPENRINYYQLFDHRSQPLDSRSLPPTPNITITINNITKSTTVKNSFPYRPWSSTFFFFGDFGVFLTLYIQRKRNTQGAIIADDANNRNNKFSIEQDRTIETNVTTPILTGRNRLFTSYLGTLSVPFRYLNTMIIQPKYNSPSSDVVNSNVPPLHCDGSHPIGGFLLGE